MNLPKKGVKTLTCLLLDLLEFNSKDIVHSNKEDQENYDETFKKIINGERRKRILGASLAATNKFNLNKSIKNIESTIFNSKFESAVTTLTKDKQKKIKDALSNLGKGAELARTVEDQKFISKEILGLNYINNKLNSKFNNISDKDNQLSVNILNSLSKLGDPSSNPKKEKSTLDSIKNKVKTNIDDGHKPKKEKSTLDSIKNKVKTKSDDGHKPKKVESTLDSIKNKVKTKSDKGGKVMLVDEKTKKAEDSLQKVITWFDKGVSAIGKNLDKAGDDLKAMFNQAKSKLAKNMKEAQGSGNISLNSSNLNNANIKFSIENKVPFNSF